MPYIETTAPAANVRADTARRTITGLVVPWGEYATVSSGQRVAFARGALSLGDRSKLVLDHDPGQPVGVYSSSTDTDTGLEATFRIPAGPAGDQALAQAAEGLRDGFSVGADITAADEADGGLWVTAARGRHVALLSEPAFDAARVSAVAATAPPAPITTGGTVTVTASTPTEPAEPDQPAEPDPEVRLTVAGAARPTVAAPARVRDPHPYAVPHIMGGPSFVHDALASMENPGSDDAARWRKAVAMQHDPAYVRAAMGAQLGFTAPPSGVQAATGTSSSLSDLTPPTWRPDRYVPLKAAKAPLWSVLTKYPVENFNTIMVPRTAAETDLAGVGADEVTPVAPGDIDTAVDTITISEIEGSYQFSRKLLLGSNPQIDAIALDALERAWLAEVEKEAVTYFVGGANVATQVGVTYADGEAFIDVIRGQFAVMATTPFTATDVVPAAKEYQAAATANGSDGHPILPYGPRFNTPGDSDAAMAALTIQGVPIWPGPTMTADHTLILDQDNSNSACAFVTPTWNFRLEWTPATGGGGNVKVLQISRYSGVGFWTQYIGGIYDLHNSTPITAGNGNSGAAAASSASPAKASTK